MGAEDEITTVGGYRTVLEGAHRALKAIEEKCLSQRKDSDKLTEADWRCIRSTYSAEMGPDRGKPPMSGSC